MKEPQQRDEGGAEDAFEGRSGLAGGRWGRRLKRLAFGLALLATLIAVFHAEENWRGKRAWTRYAQTLEDRGLPIPIADVVPPSIPDQDNFAATPFWKGLFDARGPDQETFLRERIPDHYNRAARMMDRLRMDAGDESVLPAHWQGRSLAAWAVALDLAIADPKAHTILSNDVAACAQAGDAADRVLKALSAYDPLLGEIEQASGRPKSRYPVDYSVPNPAMILLPHLSQVKTICQLLGLRAVAHGAAGQLPLAVRDLKLMVRLGDSLSAEPVLIPYLVRLACYRMAIVACQAVWGFTLPWPDDVLLDWQTRLDELDVAGDLDWCLHSERAFGNGVFDWLRKSGGGRAFAEIIGADSKPEGVVIVGMYYRLVPRGWMYLEQLNYNQLFEQVHSGTVHDVPPRIRPSQIDDIGNQLEAAIQDLGYAVFWKHRLAAAFLLPSLNLVYVRVGEGQATIDMGVVACALERHKAKKGSYPERLEALVPQYLEALPIDIVSTAPYRYQLQDTGHFQLYSVGWNEADDQGIKGQSRHTGDWLFRNP